MAVALKGAVIIEQTGGRLRYHEKCEKCGYVSGSTVSTHAPSPGGVSSTSFLCPKCRNAQSVQIKG